VARAIDEVYSTCGALARRVNAQSDERMQTAVLRGGAGPLLAGLLLAYLSIFPVALGTLGEALCVLLRMLLRLARAVGWALGTVWAYAWGRPERRVLTALARLLLALALVVWLPLAVWGYYDRELRSWPCRSRVAGTTLWAFAEPTQQAAITLVRPGAELRCFTRIVQDGSQAWRRVQVDGREAWAQDWMLDEGR
jgi:hypothetical protein